MGNLELLTSALKQVRDRFPQAKNVKCIVDVKGGYLYIETDTNEQITTKSKLINLIVLPKIKKYFKDNNLILYCLDYVEINTIITENKTEIFVLHSDNKNKVNYRTQISFNL